MTEHEVELHPVVQEIAKTIELEGGQMIMSEASLKKNKSLIASLKQSEKKPVLASLVALSTRFLREGHGAANQAAEQIMELAAILIDDLQATNHH